MGDFKGADNIYWLFSSSAQAIAAFIGFLAAGFFFTYDRIDRHVEKDETLEEIYNEIRNQYYRRIKTLFVLTGASIVLSLFVVYLNGFDLCFFVDIFKILVGLLNVITIVWAIVFVLYIIDPNKVKKTAEKLIKEDSSFSKDEKAKTLTRGEFIDKFIALEQILRLLAQRNKFLIQENSRYRNFLPLGEIIRLLVDRGIIDNSEFYDLMELNKIRNLAAHGDVQKLEVSLGEKVDRLIPIMQSKLDFS